MFSLSTPLAGSLHLSSAGPLDSTEIELPATLEPCFSPCPSAKIPLVHWRAILGDDQAWAQPGADESGWRAVQVPHNWDDYHGYHEVSHGNLHGTAWYRTPFSWNPSFPGERLYAFFEGVGSYAEVYCNGTQVGGHAGGRTTFTVDLTPALHEGENLLAVRAHHPEKIDDLPFVCGGCWGSPNTEGSQPFGIARPAWLERTGPVRVEPFGVYVVTSEVSRASARVEVRTELCNASEELQDVHLHTSLVGPDGVCVWQARWDQALQPGERDRIRQFAPMLENPSLWGPKHPDLYRVMTTVSVDGRASHQTETSFGIRWIEWPRIRSTDTSKTPAELCSTADGDRGGEAADARILAHHANALAGVVPASLKVRLKEANLPDAASLVVDLDLNAAEATEVELFFEIQNGAGTVFFHQHRTKVSAPLGLLSHTWDVPVIHLPHPWTYDNPFLHRVVVELRSHADGLLWERAEAFFGIRAAEGPLNLPAPFKHGGARVPDRKVAAAEPDNQALLVNGEELFINGTCEYENLLGCDHAFSDEQIEADVAMMVSAGFNAFRDAHHPHNLRYYDHWDRLGVVCWTQMGSHIWFDHSAFRDNFKRGVAEWVRERRNHPSVILWGIQNESAMPESFVMEIRDLIRELDPSSPVWRPTTTCNGGEGSDWNVPQDWCGTYGGNCNDYDLESRQLVGEYGAWRSFGAHTEVNYCGDENDRSETWACYAMETKIRLGEAARGKAVGHFHWLFNTFQNPGRTADNHEGDGNGQIGSVNNKGLVTAWHQPSDLFYLFRANYADPVKEPMVYIVSHTWPERWKHGGARRISVYSNCEEVELFNGVGVRSLGLRTQPGTGRHFVWEGVEPQTNVLYAAGRIAGKEVARDIITLNYLPADNSLPRWLGDLPAAPAELGKPLFRVSCGADHEVTDPAGRVWSADAPWREGVDWGSLSWGNRFENVADDLASKGDTPVPVRGSYFPELYQTYRYGRHELKYQFRLAPGTYRLRLHFTEPWFGVGGGLDCKGWRLFDIAVNGTVLNRDLDIWQEAGGDHRAVIREAEVRVDSELLVISFPSVRVGQAVICGIEVFG